MKIETLDHIALWVEDRDELTDFLVQELAMHAIDRTDTFTLVGGDARKGKLTLFAAEGSRELGPLSEIAVRVPAEVSGAQEVLEAPGGLPVRRVASEEPVSDLAHVAFRVPDPEGSFDVLSGLGFSVEDGKLRAGGAYVLLEQGEPERAERPLLNHLGLRVESAEEHLEEARRRGLEIADFVDAANTIAVFVWGPDGIKLEYVEHKPSFSLV